MQVQKEKLLGVWIDDKLNWEYHINLEMCKLIGARLALFRRIRSYLDVTTCKLYYNGYILPLMDYCSLVWGTCSDHNLNRIYMLQKSAAHIILESYRYTSTELLFNQLGWEHPSKRIYKKRMILVFKALNGMAPSYLTNFFKNVNPVHSYTLRSLSTNNLFLERGTTEMHRKRLSYLAANQWNNLPDEVKKAKTLNGFKRKLNASILQ